MPLQIVRNDIITMKVDAIVNPSDPQLSGSGGLDYLIHQKAGIKLKDACKKYQGLQVSKAVITLAYQLPSKYIIHTVGPIYEDGKHKEAKQLADCYHNVLELAKKYECKSNAIPLISAGSYGYPIKECLEIATNGIQTFLKQEEMDIYCGSRCSTAAVFPDSVLAKIVRCRCSRHLLSGENHRTKPG